MVLDAVPDIRLEPLGAQWVAFSPASGETHLLNDSAAALLEILAEAKGKLSLMQVAQALADDAEVDRAEAERLVVDSCPMLEGAGLIRLFPDDS
jgi:PqqD family protein of HPr-rel-A system